MRRRLLEVLAVAVGIALVGASAAPRAEAHAVVERTAPAAGAALESAPKEVSVTFDEAVESTFGAMRVFDSSGERVDRGDVRRESRETLSVGLERGLADGSYTATYRVVSADSHPVAGGFVFTVGEAAGRPAVEVAALIDGEAGPATEIAFGVARATVYAATAMLVGGLLFLLLVWGPARAAVGPGPRSAAGIEACRRRIVTLMLVAAGAGALATAAGVVLQGATAGAMPFWDALAPSVVDEVLATRFGTVWKFRITAFCLLAVLLLLPPRSRPLRIGALAIPSAYLVLAPALGGHSGAGDDAPVLIALDAVHVLAMSAWIGGLAMLLLAVPQATRRLERGDRSRLLATALARFSTVALVSVAALLGSGVLQSVAHLDSLSDLVETAFGRAVAIKAIIFLLLVALGAWNRLRLRPAIAGLARDGRPPGTAGSTLRRVLRAEIALMAAALGVTAALVSYQPPGAAAAGPFAGSADLGAARMEVTVDPARAGPNELHLYLFDRSSGAPYEGVRRLDLEATERERDIGPLELDVRRVGPGHFTVPRTELSPAGSWELEARARISRFEELRGAIEVPVR